MSKINSQSWISIFSLPTLIRREKNSKVIFWGPKVNANDFFIIVMVEGWEPFCQNDFGFID